MYVQIDGFDHTLDVERDTLKPSQAINDQQPRCDFDVDDPGCLLSFDYGQEVVIWDEGAPPTFTSSGRAIPTVPSINVLRNAHLLSDTVLWPASGSLSGLINRSGVFYLSMAFSNSAASSGQVQQTTLLGYVHPGQAYILSAYVQGSGTINNIQSIVKFDFLDAGGSVIAGAGVSDIRTPPITQTRVAVSATAPANAVFMQISLGGQATTTTNSGTLTVGTPQLEPMTFRAQGVSYPTPDCNYAQVSCRMMPDLTISRACRVFSGYIDDFDKEYDGENRTWTLSCNGPGGLLESGSINATFTGSYDDQIISTIVSTYFAGQINASTAPNSSTPVPVQRGVLVDSVTYSDNSFREVLNGLTDTSGFTVKIDMYYSLLYNPSYYTAANFELVDDAAKADGMMYYKMRNYKYQKDGTQRKRRVKVIGGKGLATAFEQFSGNGSNKTFTLTNIPNNINSLTVGSTNQRIGIKGRDSFSGNDVLMDRNAKQLVFNTAPPNAANNVSVIYTYEAPISTQLLAQSTSNPPTVPAYVVPLGDAKVNDTNIVSTATAITRGLAELTKFSEPRIILTFKCSQWAEAGMAIYITAAHDGIVGQPFIVQKVDGTMLGSGQNEFSYTVGAYNPTVLDHVRNANKTSNRSTTVANVTNPQSIDVVAQEIITYRDLISITLLPTYGAAVYGGASAKYGQAAYSGATGKYGDVNIRYGAGTIYG